jgi:protein phosphatase 1 regulatory subunit 11
VLEQTSDCHEHEEEATIALQKRKNSKKVVFTDDTVDNEHLNRKKSKCCCIYEKPKQFDESESESDGECENCYGHKDKRKSTSKQNGAGDGHSCPSADPSHSHEPSEPRLSN